MPDQPCPVTEADYAEADDSSTGFCVGCRKFTTGCCEPDAHDYRCDECGQFAVFGAEEALLRGLITLT